MEEMEAIIRIIHRWKRSTRRSTKESSLHCGGPQMQDAYYTFPGAREPGEGETVYIVAMEQLDQYFMP